MDDWFSLDNWPPAAQTGLAPIIDVEDISQMNMLLNNGVLASYQQCHFTPDYWRNYTIIGTEGRLENFGDEVDAEVRVWTRRSQGAGAPDEVFRVPELDRGAVHGGADELLIGEFLRFVRDGSPTETSPVAARDAVAAGIAATSSLRGGGDAREVPALPTDIITYFATGQQRT
jgi:predicted dehydrogenase